MEEAEIRFREKDWPQARKSLKEKAFKEALPIFILLPTRNSGTMAVDQAATLGHGETLRIEEKS